MVRPKKLKLILVLILSNTFICICTHAQDSGIANKLYAEFLNTLSKSKNEYNFDKFLKTYDSIYIRRRIVVENSCQEKTEYFTDSTFFDYLRLNKKIKPKLFFSDKESENVYISLLNIKSLRCSNYGYKPCGYTFEAMIIMPYVMIKQTMYYSLIEEKIIQLENKFILLD